jgi:nitroreductase
MNETLKTIHDLRTIHGNFSSREVSGKDLQIIIDACVRAANASARQSYSIVVLDDREVMKKLGYVGSKALVFCVDYNRLIGAAAYLGHKFYPQDIIAFITGSVDTILAAQTAAIAAKSLGIDSLFTNCIHRVNLNNVYELLSLPRQSCFPLIELVLGYPDKEPEYKKGRLSGKGIIHYGKYSNLSSEEINELVNEYDDKQRHIGLTDNWENEGLVHYLDWFYTKWSSRAPDEKIREFYGVLLKAGFLDMDIFDNA